MKKAMAKKDDIKMGLPEHMKEKAMVAKKHMKKPKKKSK